MVNFYEGIGGGRGWGSKLKTPGPSDLVEMNGFALRTGNHLGTNLGAMPDFGMSLDATSCLTCCIYIDQR